MIPPVYTLLSGNSGVTAICSTRIYPTIMPQDAVTPAIVWLVVSGTPNTTMTEHSPVDAVRVQVDCWADTYTTALSLANAARSALQDAGNLLSQNPDYYEPTTKKYRVSMDFIFQVTP
jgi:hypothetical protein